MKKSYWQENYLQILSALSMIAVGVYLNISTNANAAKILSAVITTFGGALLTDSTISLDKAAKLFTPQLISIGRNLANVISQIDYSIHQSKNNAACAEISIESISRLTPVLSAIVTDVSDLSGVNFDPKSHNETLEAIKELIADTESLKTTDDKQKQKAIIVENIQSLKRLYSNFETGVMDRVAEQVCCPSCNTTTPTKIGKLVPASSTPTCSACGTTFHAHRGKDGNVFSKLAGSAPMIDPIRHATIECTKCNKDVPVKLPLKGALIERFCRNCGSKLTINCEGEITNLDETEILDSKGDDAQHITGLLSCPEHGDEVRYMMRDEHDYMYAICNTGQHLIKAKRATEQA